MSEAGILHILYILEMTRTRQEEKERDGQRVQKEERHGTRRIKMTSLMTREKTDTDKEASQEIQIDPIVTIGAQVEAERLKEEENKEKGETTEMITGTTSQITETDKVEKAVETKVALYV